MLLAPARHEAAPPFPGPIPDFISSVSSSTDVGEWAGFAFRPQNRRPDASSRYLRGHTGIVRLRRAERPGIIGWNAFGAGRAIRSGTTDPGGQPSRSIAVCRP